MLFAMTAMFKSAHTPHDLKRPDYTKVHPLMSIDGIIFREDTVNVVK